MCWGCIGEGLLAKKLPRLVYKHKNMPLCFLKDVYQFDELKETISNTTQRVTHPCSLSEVMNRDKLKCIIQQGSTHMLYDN